MDLLSRYLRAIYPAVLITGLALVTTGCVLFDFPEDPSIKNVPNAGENAATITVVRKKQFAGSGITQSIMLDGVFIANLKASQYTTFGVPAGQHVLGTAWRIGGVFIIGPGGALGQSVSDFYKQELVLECVAGQHYYLVIEAKGIALHDADRIRFEQVEHLEGDFSLENKEFVPAGKSRTRK